MKKVVIVFYTLILGLAMSTGLMAEGTAPSLNGDGKYEISTLDHLLWISTNSISWSYDFIQIDDINASSTSTWNYNGSIYEGFSPIGFNYSNSFTGSYDGDGHTIDNLFINRPTTEYMGLFGFTNSAIIQNIGITNCNITGDNFTGGLIAYCYSSTVSNSYTNGRVSGNEYVGGFMGFSNSPSLVISNCYSTGSVSGTNYVGGFTGVNYSTVSNSYSTSDITRISGTNNYFGSFCGSNEYGSTIEYCYSIGNVTYTDAFDPSDKGFVGFTNHASYTNNFWDNEASNQSLATGATGKGTTEMKTESTFTNWDFTTPIWAITADINSGYPYLSDVPVVEGATPITLASFTAEVNNGIIELKWRTASETNNASFLLYRNNEIIVHVEGAGTTSETNNYVYLDVSVVPGVTYTYVLADMDYSNTLTRYDNKALTLTVGSNVAEADFVIGAAYPNPFNPSTCIDYTVTETQNIDLSIFNMKGEKVVTLFDGEKTAGHYSQIWNAASVQSGVYLLRAKYANQVKTQKLLLIK